MTETTDIKVDDLNLPDIPIEPVADWDTCIQLLNEAIDLNKEWSIDEMADGKQIDVFPEWKGEFISHVVMEYRKVGWHVLHFLHGDREFLAFYHPKKKSSWKDR